MRQVQCEVDSVRKLPERSPHGRNPLPEEHGASQEVLQQANKKEIAMKWLLTEDAVEEESLSGTILSEEKAFWQGVASHEVCAGARKLGRTAEVFADHKVENEVSDEKNG